MKLKFFTCLLVLVGSLVLARVTLADSGLQLTWSVFSGGGGTATDSNHFYSLSGTIGQPIAGNMTSAGGYGLGSGFWAGGGMSSGGNVYLPLVIKAE